MAMEKRYLKNPVSLLPTAIHRKKKAGQE